MPIPTALHDRTFPLSETMHFIDWCGYCAAGSYLAAPEHEYHACRYAAAIADVSPLFKYVLAGPGAAQWLDRLATSEVAAVPVGHFVNMLWCDEQGGVLGLGSLARIEAQRFLLVTEEPALRWMIANAAGLAADVEDRSAALAGVGLRGPFAAGIIRAVLGSDAADLAERRCARARIAGIDVNITRAADGAFLMWVDAADGVAVWDTLAAAGRGVGLLPAGLEALDVMRIEAGAPKVGVDFQSASKAQTPLERYTPFEMGLGRLVDFGKEKFIGRAALAAERTRGAHRQIVGVTIDWSDVEALHAAAGRQVVASPVASRGAAPVFARGRQVGRLTSSTWSPVLKQMIGIATVEAGSAALGTRLQVEQTVAGAHHRVGATVTDRPFVKSGTGH